MEYITNAPAGAALLDRVNPGWRNDVSLDDFDIRSWDLCILGQVYGGYGEGLNALHGKGTPGRIAFSAAHGFLDHDTDEEFNSRLEAEWINIIREGK